MLTTFRLSFKTMVQAKSSDLPLGLLIDMVVNPNTGVFEAFWVKTMNGAKLLLPKDILFWDAEQITVNDENDLALPTDLPRLRKIFDQECPILKAKVYDRALQQSIGTVRDFTFDTLSPRLLAIEVQRGLLGLQRHKIPQHRIVEIEAHQITVDSTLLKTEPETEGKKLPVLEVPELEGPRQKK